uniref:Neurotransmitter-gated ion-channel transmembrane domain-containing protein n=1 Tax=Ascaris lumbricoides TaxID=6252 RepID=A0A0M3HV40_ASCLU
MCGWTDEDDAPEKEITLKGRELVVFCVLYAFAVITIVVAFEVLMPVINNPHYPFYNQKPSLTFTPSRSPE